MTNFEIAYQKIGGQKTARTLAYLLDRADDEAGYETPAQIKASFGRVVADVGEVKSFGKRQTDVLFSDPIGKIVGMRFRLVRGKMSIVTLETR
jgi:hypothetical protein